MIRMEFDVVMKLFKLNILTLVLSKRRIERRGITAILLTALKNVNLDMPSDVYESI